VQHWECNDHGAQNTGNGLFIGKLIIMLFSDGVNVIVVGISIDRTAVIVRCDGRLLIAVGGSKIENKLLLVLLMLMTSFVFLSLFVDWMK